MEQNPAGMNEYLIYNTLSDQQRPDAFHADYHVHLLCRAGTMTFGLGKKTFEVSTGDLLIWQMTTDFTDIRYSEDFDADFLMVSHNFLGRFNPEMVWATRGYVYIKAHPVFHLEDDEWALIETDFLQFWQRIGSERFLFKDEKVGELVRLLLFDMWDIYSREMEKDNSEDIVSRHYMRFLTAVQQECLEHREVAYYAAQLNLTPKYLYEICMKLTGKSAMYWIENYTGQHIIHLLQDRSLTLTDITDRMHFSSQAMLTRYLKKTFDITPSEYRKGLKQE